MIIPPNKSASQVWQEILSRKSNPEPTSGNTKTSVNLGKLSRVLLALPRYMDSIHEINSGLDAALSKVGIRLAQHIDTAIPFGQERQFILETTDPEILLAVQIYRTDLGKYSMISYGRKIPKRRHRNPQGDFEDDMAHFIAHVIAPTLTVDESMVVPVGNGMGIRVYVMEKDGQIAWRAEVERKRQGDGVLEFSRDEQEATSYTTDREELENQIHELLHRVPRYANPDDQEPTEIDGVDVEAGVGDEMPDVVDHPEEADRIFEEFHGMPSEEEILAEEEIQVRENLSVLGRLVQLICECVADEQVYRINFGEDVMLCCSADGRQLYIVGGDQSLDLDAMGFPPEQQQKDKVFIGSAQQVTYRTRKHFDEFAEIDYVHDFGEDGGQLPAVVYDRLNLTIELAGGDYEIKPEGIVN
jgi:hypothetical protein